MLVNRGWVPPNWKAQWQDRFAALQPTGSVKVTGVVQGSESPSSFVPHNDPQQGDFFWMDVAGIVSAATHDCAGDQHQQGGRSGVLCQVGQVLT